MHWQKTKENEEARWDAKEKQSGEALRASGASARSQQRGGDNEKWRRRKKGFEMLLRDGLQQTTRARSSEDLHQRRPHGRGREGSKCPKIEDEQHRFSDRGGGSRTFLCICGCYK